MTEPTTRIVVAIDIPGTPEEAYRRLRSELTLGGSLPQDWGWETSDEWYGPDGEPLEQAEIDRITWTDD